MLPGLLHQQTPAISGMEVHVLISTHPGEVFQASVMAADWKKSWSKFFTSKQECLAELYLLGLLKMVDTEEVFGNDLDAKDEFFLLLTRAVPETLTAAEFVEVPHGKNN